MKKNKMMRAGSAILVLVLLTISVICGTFAKYTTSGDIVDDTARVAKFGVTLNVDEGGMFETSYTGTDDEVTVKTASGDKVLAPGTSGELSGSASVSGTPEVTVAVTYDAELTLSDAWTVGGSFYCPVVITVGKNTYKMGAKVSTSGNDSAKTYVFATKDDFVEAVQNAIKVESTTYEAGKAISGSGIPAVSWEWAFNDKDAEGAYQTNEKDTALGNAGNATISLKVTTTVTQID